MEAVTYQNLVLVLGDIYAGVIKLEINETLNAHGTISLEAIIDNKQRKKVLHESKESFSVVYIKDKVAVPLFTGIITFQEIDTEGKVSYLKIYAKTATYFMDFSPMSRSFQDVKMTSHELIKEVMQGSPGSQCILHIPNKRIDELVLQYEETNWEFLKRFVSRYHAQIRVGSSDGGVKLEIGSGKPGEAPTGVISIPARKAAVKTETKETKDQDKKGSGKQMGAVASNFAVPAGQGMTAVASDFAPKTKVAGGVASSLATPAGRSMNGVVSNLAAPVAKAATTKPAGKVAGGVASSLTEPASKAMTAATKSVGNAANGVAASLAKPAGQAMSAVATDFVKPANKVAGVARSKEATPLDDKKPKGRVMSASISKGSGPNGVAKEISIAVPRKEATTADMKSELKSSRLTEGQDSLNQVVSEQNVSQRAGLKTAVFKGEALEKADAKKIVYEKATLKQEVSQKGVLKGNISNSLTPVKKATANTMTAKPIAKKEVPKAPKPDPLCDWDKLPYSIDQNLERYHYLQENGLPEGTKDKGISYQIKTYDIVPLGFTHKFHNKQVYVAKVLRRMEEGILVNYYTLCEISGLKRPQYFNDMITGTSIYASVLGSKRNRVQVQLAIDGKEKPSNPYWFPFSTVAASSDGSGWYCMPKDGEQVRIFFPENKENDGYAITTLPGHNPSTPSKSDPMGNPAVKNISTPDGKEITFTETGIAIAANGENGQVNLDQDGSITINGIEKITIAAGEKIIMDAKKSIKILAENKLSMASDTGGAITIEPGNVDITGTEIHQN